MSTLLNAAMPGLLVVMMMAATAHAQDEADIAGRLKDAIVGAWAGEAAQPENDPFPVRLTFVSPRGGVSRYPSDPACGGMLVGGRKGDGYEYQETITYGGEAESSTGCLSGTMRLTVQDDTMKYEWSTVYNGREMSSSGELKRQGVKTASGSKKKR